MVLSYQLCPATDHGCLIMLQLGYLALHEQYTAVDS